MTPQARDELARRVAADLPEGAYVNLGIGLPTRVAGFVRPGADVIFHSENGLLGVGPAPAPQAADPELINAGKELVTLLPGAAIFDHATAFAMIRGGHIDVAIMGAYEVSATGDLANWSAGGRSAPAVGGAMDLAAGARAVWIMMEHCTKDGAPRLVAHCSLPLTGAGVVTRVYTDLAVIDVDGGFAVRALCGGCDAETLRTRTGAPLHGLP
jgi:3-oxoadipate CoA-transferase, beta subunit